MPSILDRHATDSQTRHECGGTVLVGGEGEQEHAYCDRCGAFRYTEDSSAFPTGTDKAANNAAWDAGKTRSPDA
jgi:ribosomal protein L37E